MRRPFRGLRGRRPLFTAGILFNTALIGLAMSTLGATPAAAAGPNVTETAWIPLHCNIGGPSSGPAVHIAVALRATHPASLNPNENFRLTNVTAVQVLPPLAQQVGYVTFGHSNAVEGIVKDFEQVLTNAKGTFTPGGTGTQVNAVAAMQPPNADAPPVGTATVSQTSPRDPLIDPNTAHPSPLAAWTNNNSNVSVPPSDPRRHDEFSFGPIPTSGSATGNAYGPAPGTGGGAAVTSGTADAYTIRPFTVTGSPGQNVVLDVGDASRPVTHSDYADPGPTIAIAGTFFFAPGAGKWIDAGGGNPYPIYCGQDNSPKRTAKPDPTMVDRFVIPINCDEGGNHQDGGGPMAGCQDYGHSAVVLPLSIPGGNSGVASAAAILVVLSTFLLVAVRRRRAGRL